MKFWLYRRMKTFKYIYPTDTLFGPVNEVIFASMFIEYPIKSIGALLSNQY